ncbi:MAG: hypothetical protein ABSA75_05360 [Candidatus Bathyarchaeia archaeon]|jgi:hypothetical protein
MKLLFEQAAQVCLSPPESRIQKLKTWVEQANMARNKGNLEPYPNQYDKAEELITFYTFAPLVLSSNKVVLTNQILTVAGINQSADSVVSLCLEKQYPPPAGYLSWIKDEVKNHPVRYIREKAINRLKANQPLESNTHVDAFIETNNFIIFFEMKFTSDISYGTTFNPARNQLARLIDVGLEVAKRKGKKLLVFLSTPNTPYSLKSRLYYYKIQEYASPLMIQKEIPWRPVKDIEENLLTVKWIALEELINLLYKDFNHHDKEKAMEFFKERLLSVR